MVSGFDYDRVQGIKVNTDLPISTEELKNILEDQKYDNKNKKLNNTIGDINQERKIIVKDLSEMKKSLYEQIEKKAITKNELIFHNDTLKQNKNCKDEEEARYRN